MTLERICKRLSRAVSKLNFSEPVTHIYNPLDYAWQPHRKYLKKYGNGQKKILLMGMNPGPYGMAQTGVPFGEVAAVRDWLQITAPVKRPANEHPKRPIDGFDCSRSEVSGRRLWGWAKERWQEPQSFFEDFFVHNYCPLVFMEEGGRNRTPDKLPASEREALFAICDRAVAEMVKEIGAQQVIGVGAFAEKRAQVIFGERIKVNRILHPSPASPLANKGWAQTVNQQLEKIIGL